jgi:hypothetical protein
LEDSVCRKNGSSVFQIPVSLLNGFIMAGSARTLPVLFLIVWLLPFNDYARAENRLFFQDENLVVIGENRLESEAAHIVQIYPGARSDIERILGWGLLSRPRVYLTANREDFEKISGSPFVSALAIPSEHIILIHISSATSKAYVLSETFKHELCHLLLHDHISESNLPRWLDEGICQWISGTLGELLRAEGTTISRIEMARRLIPLNRLAVSFPRDRESLFLAYEEGRSFVEYVAAHYGTESILRILRRLKEGDSIEAAFPSALSKSFGEVQAEWIDDLQSRSEWLIWMTQNLYEIIFFGMAVLTVFAAIRLRGRVRKAKFSDEDGDDDTVG